MNLYAGSSTVENVACNTSPREPIDGLVNGESVAQEGVIRAGVNPQERPCENWKAVGSNPTPRAKIKIKPIQFRWREPLGKPECPYVLRTLLNLGLFSIRLHEWNRSDDKRYMHDHPWWFATIVLRGSYTDVSQHGRDMLKRWSIRFRHASYAHYVEIPKPGTVTLVLTGPKCREWGFWVKGKFKRPLRFFGKFGHPPCHEQ